MIEGIEAGQVFKQAFESQTSLFQETYIRLTIGEQFFVKVEQGVGRGKIPVQPFFQGAVKSFHHTGFGIAFGGKMMNPLLVEPSLKRPVVKFFPPIRLQSIGVSSSLFQNLLKGFHEGHPRFVFQGLHPRVLGQDIHDGQQVAYTPIIFGQRLHFD